MDHILLGVNSGAVTPGPQGSAGTDTATDAQQLFGLLLGQMLGLTAPNAHQTPQPTGRHMDGSLADAAHPAAAPMVMQDIDGETAPGREAAPDEAAVTAEKSQAPLAGGTEEAGELLRSALKEGLLAHGGADSAPAATEAPELTVQTLQPGAVPAVVDPVGHAAVQGVAPTPPSAPSPTTPATLPLPAAQPPADGAPKFADRVVHASIEGNKLAVTIEPKGLGTMDINLSLDRGVVHAQVQVAQDNARHLIESNLQQLLDALSREGISLGGFNISLKNQDGAWRQASGNGRDRNGPDLDGADAAVPAAHRHAEPGRLSIYA